MYIADSASNIAEAEIFFLKIKEPCQAGKSGLRVLKSNQILPKQTDA